MTIKYTRVVADENVPREVVEVLKGMGFKEVYWISQQKPGIPDTRVWKIAMEKQAILITGDIGFLPQLTLSDILNGPVVVEYSTKGFTKNELQDSRVMCFFMEWLFGRSHHKNREHIQLFIDGKVKTKRQRWSHESSRRSRQP